MLRDVFTRTRESRAEESVTQPCASNFNTLHTDHAITRDRAIFQAVSRRPPTAAARVRARFRSCGICGGQSGAGAGFLRVLRFPLPIRYVPIAPQSSSITYGWYNGPNSGLSPHEKKNNIVACLLKAVIAETEQTFVAKQWFCKPPCGIDYSNPTLEELL
jgi:hypothetical protein